MSMRNLGLEFLWFHHSNKYKWWWVCVSVSMKNQTLYIDRFSLVSSLVVTSELQFLRLNPERSNLRLRRTERESRKQCWVAAVRCAPSGQVTKAQQLYLKDRPTQTHKCSMSLPKFPVKAIKSTLLHYRPSIHRSRNSTYCYRHPSHRYRQYIRCYREVGGVWQSVSLSLYRLLTIIVCRVKAK